jgi:transcriptional regulator with XRE-family HTH domain
MLKFAPRLFVNKRECKAPLTVSQQKSEALLTFSKMSIDREKLFSRIMEASESRTAANLAEKLNITRQAVYGWRDGKNLPELDKIIEISNVTRTSLHWLLTGEGSKEIGATQEMQKQSQVERLLLEASLPEIFTEIFNRLEVLEAQQAAQTIHFPQGDLSEQVLADNVQEATSEVKPAGSSKSYKR